MFERDKQELINGLIASGYLKSRSVIDAMLAVERHLFVPDDIRIYAYSDQPLPVGEEQTISAPHMVAMMCELLDLEEGLRILEIGAGTGYHACVVAHITRGSVFSIEAKARLLERARENLKRSGCSGVELIEGDGTIGYEKEAPYDRIYVTAGAPEVPGPLLGQLKAPGLLLIPVGSRYMQNLVLVEKTAKGEIKETELSGCAFVPLVGEHGW